MGWKDGLNHHFALKMDSLKFACPFLSGFIKDPREGQYDLKMQ
jgi:hypothetical protein